MLPEFPESAKNLERRVIALVKNQIPNISPLLGQVGRFAQHEGKRWSIRSEDGSTHNSGYIMNQVAFEIDREAIRRQDIGKLFEAFGILAKRLSEQECKIMFQRIDEATKLTDNVVNAGTELRKEHFLELVRKKDSEFDPVTRKPINDIFVMNPDTAKKVLPIMKAWEHDCEFVRQYNQIIEQIYIEWRERESSRKLVD